MRNILVPVDGSESALRAVTHALSRHPAGTAKVHLLNVEPAPVDWQTHGLARGTIDAHLHELGESKLGAAKALLTKAGVPFESRVLLGEPAEVIQRAALEGGADEIVMGTRGLGAVAGLLLGSVATKVLHLTHLPVTLVK